MPKLDEGPASEEDLLAQMSWIRRLARRLVLDQELAEDLVQDTVVVALEQRPSDLSKLRRWLASVMRNLLRQHVRGSGRRRQREELSARREALESTEALVERVSVQRELTEHVLALHEPYRSVVILRFFDELPPREISRRLGVPVTTVNSRLQRGLALLRRRLDAAHEEQGRGWMAALLPLVERLEFSSSSAIGGLIVNAKAALALVLVLAAAGAIVWFQRPDAESVASGADLARPAVPVRSDLPAAAFEPGVAEATTGEARRALAAGAEAPVAPTADAGEAALRALRVRVLDGQGAPVSGVPLTVESTAEVIGSSGAGGWLEVRTAAESRTLVVEDPRWVTVHAGEWRAEASYDPVVVIAPAIRLAGRVEDARGERLPGARVRYALPEDFRTRFADILDAASDRSWIADADADGAFELVRVPAIDGAELRAVLLGYEADVQPAPVQSAEALTLILTRPEAPLAGTVRGRVVDPEGLSVDGARVALGLDSVVTDESGDFEIELFYAVTSEALTAVKEGFLPARMERPGVPGEEESGWPDFVVLELPGPALTIRGRVVDHEGEPVADAKVWLQDPSPTAPIGMMPTSLESQMAGGTVPPMALESRSRRPPADEGHFNDWSAPAGPPTALWYWVPTDGEGRFELGGLDERHYRLNVMPSNGLDIQTTAPIRAGRAGSDDVTIVLPKPDLHGRVAGVVRTPDGRPVAGASVVLWRPVYDTTSRVFGGTSQVILTERGGKVKTDAEGRFSFADVPREGASLSIRGDDIVPTSYELENEDRPRNLELVVDVRCHLEVIVRNPGDKPFDAIALADDDGNRLDVLIIMESGVSAYTDVPLVGGKSGVVSVSSRATRLILLENGQEADSMRIELLPGRINSIEH